MKRFTGLILITIFFGIYTLEASADLFNLKKKLEQSMKAVTEQSKQGTQNQIPDTQQPAQEIQKQESQQAVSIPEPSSKADVQQSKTTQSTTPDSASVNSIREKWLSDPYPETPPEVKTQDIQDVARNSLNKIYVFLKSPVMSKTYKLCQEKEEIRIGKKAIDFKQAANNAKTSSEKSEMLSQAKNIESLKSKLSSSTCLFRTIRRATIDLNLEYYGTQPEHAPPKNNDEQLHVVQVFKVAKALETNQFTNKFNSALSEELSINYDDWMQKYIVSSYKLGADELKKSTNSYRQKSEIDQGANFGLTRKSQFYDQAIESIGDNILNGSLKP